MVNFKLNLDVIRGSKWCRWENYQLWYVLKYPSNVWKASYMDPKFIDMYSEQFESPWSQSIIIQEVKFNFKIKMFATYCIFV